MGILLKSVRIMSESLRDPLSSPRQSTVMSDSSEAIRESPFPALPDTLLFFTSLPLMLLSLLRIPRG